MLVPRCESVILTLGVPMLFEFDAEQRLWQDTVQTRHGNAVGG
ncbi:hypothetical protein [Streptomyces griseorubiginosus]|nr:hypothetical protein [Streptomyces griseorubiginosus]